MPIILLSFNSLLLTTQVKMEKVTADQIPERRLSQIDVHEVPIPDKGKRMEELESGVFNLKSETQESFTGDIVIVDSQNIPLKTVPANGGEVTINVPGLRPGIYHVTYTLGDKYQISRVKIE